MSRGQQQKPPEGEHDKGEAAQRAPGKTASALAELPARHQQQEIENPDKNGIIQQRIAPEIDTEFLLEQKRAEEQAATQQGDATEQQDVHDAFQALDRGQEGKNGAQFMKFQIVFLGQEHERRDRAQPEGSDRKENEGGMQADKAIRKIGLGGMGRVKGGHEGKHAHEQ